MPKIYARYEGGIYCAPLYDNVDTENDCAFHVYSVDGLLAWAAACKSDMGTGCILHGSLDMAGIEWTPVGTSSNPYEGIFDGGGHVLLNLSVEAALETDIAVGGNLSVAGDLSVSGDGRTYAEYSAGTAVHVINSEIYESLQDPPSAWSAGPYIALPLNAPSSPRNEGTIWLTT